MREHSWTPRVVAAALRFHPRETRFRPFCPTVRLSDCATVRLSGGPQEALRCAAPRLLWSSVYGRHGRESGGTMADLLDAGSGDSSQASHAFFLGDPLEGHRNTEEQRTHKGSVPGPSLE